mmetsp:Transcript_96723/g.191758  ORF Transcript_96723/g.191758 Transcript_96723/m.191758 type:complete len:564 (+) Transcript_96723:45-1736(+)
MVLIRADVMADEIKLMGLCSSKEELVAGPRSDSSGIQALTRAAQLPWHKETGSITPPLRPQTRRTTERWHDRSPKKACHAHRRPHSSLSMVNGTKGVLKPFPRYPPGMLGNIVTYSVTSTLPSAKQLKRPLSGSRDENEVKTRPVRVATAATDVQPVACQEASQKWLGDALSPLFTPSLSNKRPRRDYRLPLVPLPPAGPRPTPKDFYVFVSEREWIRRKREACECWPWTEDEVLQKFRFTNVKRSDDRTTKVVQRLLQEQNEAWARCETDSLPDNKARAMSHLLNIAVWRRFGSVDFIERVGWRSAPKNEFELDVWEEHTVEVAKSLWQERVAACTDAYFPARCVHNAEVSAWAEAEKIGLGTRSSSSSSTTSSTSASSCHPKRGSDPEARMRKCYAKLLRHWRMKELWKALPRIVEAMDLRPDSLEPQSWQRVVERMREVEGFGGTGFSAKEVVLDFLLTPLMCRVADFDSWCPVGPGACRGLNRLAGRKLKDVPASNVLLEELLTLFREAPRFYPQTLAEERPLTLHDVQFQLCEFDKYMRVKNGGGGRVRPFEPPPLGC